MRVKNMVSFLVPKLPTCFSSYDEKNFKLGYMKDSPNRIVAQANLGASPTPLWRRSNLASGGTTGSSSNSSDSAVWLVMRTMSAATWCKEQWMLWGAVGTVVFAYYVPLLTSSDLVTSVCVAAVFFLSGASFPFEELRHAVSNLHGIVIALVHTFVVSPILILGAYSLPIFDSVPKKEMLLAGMLCAFCLPPSSASALVATGASSGNESITLCVSAIGSLIGLFVSPALMRMLVKNTQFQQSRDLIQFLGQFTLIVVLPLIAGQAVQYIGWVMLRKPSDELKRQVTSAAAFCSDVCDTNQRNWRGRVRVLLYIIMLFLSYTIFCSLFYNPTNVEAKVSWEAVGTVFAVELIGYALLCIIAWVSTGFLPLGVEDRVATFFSCLGKTEVLAIPLLSQVFVNREDLAVLLIPSMTYHLIQCVGSSLLTFPLRQWRNRQHCKPGTTLLPLRYIKVPRHLAKSGSDPSLASSGVPGSSAPPGSHHHHGADPAVVGAKPLAD